MGQSPHLTIGDKTLAPALFLMKKIGLTKDLRAKEIEANEKEWPEFLQGLK